MLKIMFDRALKLSQDGRVSRLTQIDRRCGPCSEHTCQYSDSLVRIFFSNTLPLPLVLVSVCRLPQLLLLGVHNIDDAFRCNSPSDVARRADDRK